MSKLYFLVLFLVLSLNYELCFAQNSGSLRVSNGGAYVAKFSVTFSQNGNRITYYSGDFPAGQSRTLELPYGACCATILAENLVFIGTWRDVFRLDLSTPVYKCYGMWGTTFNPGWGEENC